MLQLAREHGYSTAVVGKLGPVAIQDIQGLRIEHEAFAEPAGIIIDDSTDGLKTNAPANHVGIPLLAAMVDELTRKGFMLKSPLRGDSGKSSGTLVLGGHLKSGHTWSL